MLPVGNKRAKGQGGVQLAARGQSRADRRGGSKVSSAIDRPELPGT
jgi:hypothetical protein